ncbi:PRD domain-containing protein [Alteribacillus sp. HJP-4]|uniref:PRD domain-containing protein n=1 Tax=Alteribacillus sp. HJP-4 TaxID=2775394 RepID=UPI0035CD1D97
MKIIKILNHNAAIVDDGQQEKVAVGAGIAFQKKKNDIVDETAVEKLFILNELQKKPFKALFGSENKMDAAAMQRNITWLEEHPDQLQAHMESLQFMTSVMEEELKADFSKNSIAYEGLLTHLYIALKSADQGEHLSKPPESMIEMMKLGYPQAFKSAEKAVSALHSHFGLKLPEDETIYIAMHVQRLIQQGT